MQPYFAPLGEAEHTEPELQQHLELSQMVWSVMVKLMQDRAVRQEAFALLTESLATISPQPAPAARQAAFSSHLSDKAYLSDSSRPGPQFAVQLLRLYCEAHPAEVANSIDLHRPKAVEAYFRGSDSDRTSSHRSSQVDEQRVAAFFCGAGAAGGDRQSGPVAAFCLDNRAKVWDLLVWNSRRAHSPVAVLTRPQFWDDLDIFRTVSSLASSCPDFWSSRQLWEHIRHGRLIEADPAFFAGHLLKVLQSANNSDSGRGDRDRGDCNRDDGGRDDGGRSDGSCGDGARGDGDRGSSRRGDDSRGDGGRGDGGRVDNDRGDGDRGSSRCGDGDWGSSRRSHQVSEEASGRRRHAARRLTAAVDAFVSSSSYAVLCRQLLHLLPSKDAVAAAQTLTEHLHCQTDHVHGQTVRQMGAKELSQRLAPRRTSGASSRDRSAMANRYASTASTAPTAPTDPILTARQPALCALLSDGSQQELDSLLVAHGAVIRSGHMLRWLHDDPNGAQALKHVVQQQNRSSTALWNAKRLSEMPSTQCFRMLAADALLAHHWLSAAKDGNRLKDCLRAANIRFEVAVPSNQLLLDEPDDDDDGMHRRKKSKRRSSQKRKRRAETEATTRESPVESTVGDLAMTDVMWALGNDSVQLRTEDVQQLLCQETYYRRTIELGEKER